MADSVRFGHPGSARRGLTAMIAVGAALTLVSPVGAQSPSPSTVPAASVAPGASVAPSAGATTLGPLQALEATFAAQACDPFLTAAELSSATGVPVAGASGGHVVPQSDRAGFIGLDCTWSVAAGTVRLLVEEDRWTGKKKPKVKDHISSRELKVNRDATKLAGPGDVAYSDPGSDYGQYPGRPNVAWAVWLKHGKAYADRQLRLFSNDLDIAVLETLANVVRSDATPGDAPVATAPGDGAAALLGSWTLSNLEGISLMFEPPTMTATFADSGTVTTSYDCKGFDGKKPDAYTHLYFVDADRIAMVTDVDGASSEEGQCFDGNGPPDIGQLQLAEAFDQVGESTWVVDGDTLTITGANGEQPFTWTFDRAAG